MSRRTAESEGRLSVLLLCDDSPGHAPNVLEHIQAFRRFSRHRVDVFNPSGVERSRLLRLDDYDVVVVHYSLTVLFDSYLSPWFRDELTRFRGLKVQFIQDEYRWVDAMTARMRELGIDVLFSSVPPDAVPDVYGSRLPGVDILPTLTGYVPAELEGRPRPSLDGRPLDVVYRGRSIPYSLGRLGQDKALIGREFLARAESTDLRCDISWSEADRIYGGAWYPFLGSARTTLGTESGASIVDFDGSLQERTESYLKTNPAASFEEVEREVLAPFEGNAVIEAISPRVFEAAALGTAMVNFTGRYSDVIEPWAHYVPLEKDFSNFDEVVSAIREDATLERIAARAHADLVASGAYSLETFVRGVEHEIEARAEPVERRPRGRVAGKMKRKLLTVEQLGSRKRLAKLPLVVSLQTSALERVSRRLIQRFTEVESLARRAELEGDREQRLRRDLVRLAAASAAHLRELRYLGSPFDVQVELVDEDRRLMLVGTREPAQDPARLEELRDRVAAAIHEGRLREIVWDNSAVTGALPFLSLPIAWLEIGYHVVIGAYRFTALEEVARNAPDDLITALAPLFRRRPTEPVHELERRTALLVDVAARPGDSAARALALLLAPLAGKEVRRLLVAYLASRAAQTEAPPHLLVRDLLRFRLIAESPTKLELEDERSTLVYRTTPSGSDDGMTLEAATVRELQRIVWDNSAVGPLVTSTSRPQVTVMLDESGLYEFRALTPVARRFPDLAVAALRRAASRA